MRQDKSLVNLPAPRAQIHKRDLLSHRMDGQLAHRGARKSLPHLIDFAFLGEIEKRCEFQDIPIVILTAMPLGAAERELLARRTQEVIGKGADDLAEVLRRTLLRLPKPTRAVAAG